MKSTYPSIVITREAPLIVYDPSDVMHYNTVYMELGAYIEIRAGSVFEIDTLTQLEDLSAVPRNCCTEYPTLGRQERPADWNYHIIVTGTPGTDGKNGEDGTGSGGSGDKGTPAPYPGGSAPAALTITIREMTFPVTILNVGGAGGRGGTGGKGAPGYNGESAEKPGGIGGDGGDGGNGSNGGSGTSKLTVKYKSSAGHLPAVTCLAAGGGAGGQGGNHGSNGKYYVGTAQPKNGSDGSGGISGGIGKYTLEPL